MSPPQQLASISIDKSNLTLTTSTNNQAVSNVLEKLDTLPSADLFYLPGGKKEIIEQQAIPKLQAAIDWLSFETFDESEWKQTSSEIVTGVKELQQQLELDRENESKKKKALRVLEQLRTELQTIERQIEAIEQQVVTNDYSQYPLEAYEQILFHLEKAVCSLPRHNFNRFPRTTVNQQTKKIPWWQRLWYFLLRLWQKITKTSTHHIVEQLSASINAPLTATLATPFPFRLPLNREELIAARVRVAEQLELVRGEHHQQSQNQTNNLQEQRNELQERLRKIEQKIASYPTEDFYTRFPQEYHQQQQRLFALSWDLLQLVE